MLLALDAEEFDAGFMKTFRNDCHPRMAEDSEERTFAHKDHTYGAYVSYKHTEYELGEWRSSYLVKQTNMCWDS